MQLVYPKLKLYKDLIKNYKILQALLELNVQNDDEFELLSDEFKNLLNDKQNIEKKFNNESANLNRLIGVLANFYVDKNKFKGINVKNKLEAFIDILNTEIESEDFLLETLNSTTDKWKNPVKIK